MEGGKPSNEGAGSGGGGGAGGGPGGCTGSSAATVASAVTSSSVLGKAPPTWPLGGGGSGTGAFGSSDRAGITALRRGPVANTLCAEGGAGVGWGRLGRRDSDSRWLCSAAFWAVVVSVTGRGRFWLGIGISFYIQHGLTKRRTTQAIPIIHHLAVKAQLPGMHDHSLCTLYPFSYLRVKRNLAGRDARDFHPFIQRVEFTALPIARFGESFSEVPWHRVLAARLLLPWASSS